MRFSALLLLLLLPLTAAHAQGDIHRCVGPDGKLIFTDQVCSDLDAKPALPAASGSASAVSPISPPLPPPPVLCAKDVEDLKQAVVDAFAARNPNRMAGLMLWNGADRQTVVVYIRALTGLMTHPLLDVDADGGASSYDQDDDASGTVSSRAPARGGTLVVQAGSDDGGGNHLEARYDIIPHAGCLWLRPQG